MPLARLARRAASLAAGAVLLLFPASVTHAQRAQHADSAAARASVRLLIGSATTLLAVCPAETPTCAGAGARVDSLYRAATKGLLAAPVRARVKDLYAEWQELAPTLYEPSTRDSTFTERTRAFRLVARRLLLDVES